MFDATSAISAVRPRSNQEGRPGYSIRILKFGLVGLVLAAVSITAAGWALPRAEAHFATHGPPGAEPLSAPVTFEGRVVERLDAGRYGYLRIAGDSGEERWLVSIRPAAKPGDRVKATAHARARSFASKRLGRSFDDLHFGPVSVSK